MRTAPAALLAVLALAAPLGAAPPTGALEGLRQTVIDRLVGLDPGAPRKDRRALEKARHALAAVPADLVAEYGVASKAAKSLDRAFAADAELAVTQENALIAMNAIVYSEISFLESKQGTLGSVKSERTLEKGILGADRRLDGVFAKPRAKRAAAFAKVCALVERTAGRVGLEFPEDPGDPDPEPGDPVADFALNDLNATSPRAGEAVSPRDYLGGVSAWYFGHAT